MKWHHRESQIATIRRRLWMHMPLVWSFSQQSCLAIEAHPEQAKGFLGIGASPAAKDLPAHQVAAAAILVNAIMNLDEAVSKR